MSHHVTAVAALVPWKADAEIEIFTQAFIRECMWDQQLYKGGEGRRRGREGSRWGQKEKLGCDTVAKEVSANLTRALNRDGPTESS